ncbi:MAG: enolase C-terminal domain-like protein [bacterium]
MKIDSIEIISVNLEPHYPFITSHSNYSKISRLFLRICSGADTVFSECAALPDRSYFPESIQDARQTLESRLIPCIQGYDYTDIQDLSYKMNELVSGQPLSKACIEMGAWKLEAKKQQQELWQQLGINQTRQIQKLPAMGIKESLEALSHSCQQLQKQGYRHLKVKIKPGNYLKWVETVVDRYPDIRFVLDANESFTLDQALSELTTLKGRYRYIEQPLNRNDWAGLSQLQKTLNIPLCLDESITCLDDIQRMKREMSGRRVSLKPAKLGGFWPAIQCVNYCDKHRIPCHIGGLLESEIGRSYTQALAMHPRLDPISELCPASHYWKTKVSEDLLKHMC